MGYYGYPNGVFWTPAWILCVSHRVLNVHIGTVGAHTGYCVSHAGTSSALTRACEKGACMRVCTASRYRLATMHHLRRTERRASNSPPRGWNTPPTVRRAKPHTCVVHEVHVCCLPPHCCVARARGALSTSPSSASCHDRCRWAARQLLMRTASRGRCVAWHVA